MNNKIKQKGSKMLNSRNTSKSQADIQIQSQINDFFDYFKIGTLLHRCGIRKRHGYGVRFLIERIFTLPFIGKNFYRGIVVDEDISCGKDSVYEILKGVTYNWRMLLLQLGYSLFVFFNPRFCIVNF